MEKRAETTNGVGKNINIKSILSVRCWEVASAVDVSCVAVARTENRMSEGPLRANQGPFFVEECFLQKQLIFSTSFFLYAYIRRRVFSP